MENGLSMHRIRSKSYGNTEGLVKSDIEQDDAGITQDFDFPELMDGAFGDTPNDRRHSFKAYGTYALMDNLLVGANARLTSGRPLNAFGIGHQMACQYMVIHSTFVQQTVTMPIWRMSTLNSHAVHTVVLTGHSSWT